MEMWRYGENAMLFKEVFQKRNFNKQKLYSHMQFSQITYCDEIHPETLPVLCRFLSMFLKYGKQSGRASL